MDRPTHTNDGPLDYKPQVLSDTFVSDVSNWVLIADTIEAQEAYSYITIGNFHDDNATNTKPNPTSSNADGTYGAFYFVDDVKVEALNITGANDVRNDEFLIYPTNVTEVLNIKIISDSWVEVHNCQGQLLYAEQVSKGLKKINTAYFSKGIYIVSVQNSEKSFSARIIK